LNIANRYEYKKQTENEGGSNPNPGVKALAPWHYSIRFIHEYILEMKLPLSTKELIKPLDRQDGYP